MKTAICCLVFGLAVPHAAAWAEDGGEPGRRALTVQRVHRLPAPHRLAAAAVPVVIPVDPAGFVKIQTPFTEVETPDGPALIRIPHYQGPDGTYDTPADLTDAINGIPCGTDCTARALERWGYQP